MTPAEAVTAALLPHLAQCCLCDALMLDCWCRIAAESGDHGLAEALADRAGDARQLALRLGRKA